MKRKVMNVAKMALGNLVLVGLLTGCGNMVDLDVPESLKQEVVESVSVEESEASVTQPEEESVAGENSEAVGENNAEAESRETEETSAVAENEVTTEAQEYEELYIIYEDMEPTTMYVTKYVNLYPDFNTTNGERIMKPGVYEGDKIIVDGKGTFKDVEYYRIQRSEDSTDPYCSVIPANALSLEKPGFNTGNEAASEKEDQDLWFNGTSYVGTLREVEQKYMKYEDMEPTTMYVINNPDIKDENEIYSVYNDPNVTEGVVMMGGIQEAGAEVLIDGKGVYNGVEYYRIAYKEGTMLDFQLIIPAEYLTTEE